MLSTAALLVIIYLAAILGIGAMGPRRSSLEEFHLAGRSLRLVLLTGTFCVTIVGASSTLGMAGLGYSKGLPGAWWMLSGTIGLLLLALFLAEKIRSARVWTLPELVGIFYGEKARLATSALVLISWIGVIAVQIVACGTILRAIFGGNQTLLMAACTLVFVLYTAHGGQRSVVRTDLVQLFIIVSGIGLLFIKCWEVAGLAPFASQSFPTSADMGTSEVVFMVVVVGSAYLIGPDMYSRLFSAQSPEIAKRAALFSAVLLIPLAFAITSLGIFASAFYPHISPEEAIPVLMTGILSPGLVGIVAAAFLAAFMSSADTTLMTATSILTLDLYSRIWPKSSAGHILKVSQVSSVGLGLLAFIVAVFSPSIIKTILLAYTVFTGGLLVPVIAGFFRERLRLTSSGALAALAGGGTSALMLGQSYPLLGMLVSAVLLLAVSWIDRFIKGKSAPVG